MAFTSPRLLTQSRSLLLSGSGHFSIRHILATIILISMLIPAAGYAKREKVPKTPTIVVPTINQTLLPLPAVPNLESDDVIQLDPSKEGQRDLELSTPLFLLDDSQVQDRTSENILSPEDENNLKLLWMAVLRRNPTLQFALKQLNVSPSIREHHKSIGARVLSGMLGGVGLIPYAFGTSPGTISAATASANVTDRLNNIGGIDPRTLPSDAEMVTLSSTVESVRSKVIHNYFAYRTALESLGTLSTEKQTLNRFNKAGAGNNSWIQQLTSIAEKQRIDEELLHLTQQAQLSYIQLERVCGPEALSSIKFGYVAEAPAITEEPALAPDTSNSKKVEETK